jgi:general secretion pathway protein E
MVIVFSTLHTNNAPAAITRLINIGLPAYLIQQTIVGVMAQRLIRTLCRHCKRPSEISNAEWQSLVAPFKVAKPDQVHHAVGCLECRNTGYSGRIGIYEIFETTTTLQKLIVEGYDTELLQKQACLEGMRPLRLSGAEKVAKGLTTIEEVLRVGPEGVTS